LKAIGNKMMSNNKKEEITIITVQCPYCQSKFKDTAELSKHIDRIHTGLGLLEGNKRQW
jgi:uncharacterized C2H2 Zn-finger protein